MSTLELKNVSYLYEKNKPVLKDINMIFQSGSLYAVLGPSGAGKTTLLSLLGGLDAAAEGSVLFNGEDILKKELHFHRRNNVSLIFQNYNLIDYMTAEENVCLCGKSEALPLLEKLGLSREEAKRNVLKLSGGQQQRVAVGRALACEAPFILADEPTGNLDGNTAEGICEMLKEIAHVFGKCVIVVTHSFELAKEADVVLKIENGNLIK